MINSLEGLGEGSILIPFGAFSLSSDEDGQHDEHHGVAETWQR